MVLATQCLLQRRPKTYEVSVDGRLSPGVGAKDVILNLLSRIGVGGGTGHVFEYRGSAIEALSMEQRMTICNMSIEGGARAGLIAPDDTTFEYLARAGRTPRTGAAWDAAVERWRALPTDDGATFDKIDLDRRRAPSSRWSPTARTPGWACRSRRTSPIPRTPRTTSAAAGLEQALAYMDLAARAAAARPEGRRRVHRLVHQRPDQRPPARGRGAWTAAKSPTASGCWSCRARTR